MKSPPAGPSAVPIGSNSTEARDLAYVLHPFTNLQSHLDTGPIVIERSKGVRIWDNSGKEYIDSIAGLWCTALGFDNKRLVEAATRQMKKLPYYHSFTSKSHEPLIDLAEMLIKRSPVPMSKAFFANSGSEANDTAVRMIWYFNNAIGRPKKKKLIGRVKGYHGITVASASLTGLPINQLGFDAPLPGFLHAMAPHYYQEAQPGETEEEFASRCAQELECLILKEDPETVAAMWVEPVMGAGGVIVPPPTYFEKIQEVLRRHDVLLVVDEVICGFWRTGNYWGSNTFNITPDVITCAKALSSSYFPISAVMVNQRIFDALVMESGKRGLFGHGPTYSGHPVGAAVAIEALKIYDELNFGEYVQEVGKYLRTQLENRFRDHPFVGDIRGVGLMAAIEFVRDKGRQTKFDPELNANWKLVELMEQEGVIGRVTTGEIMCFSPPLIITKDEIDDMLDRITRAIRLWEAQISVLLGP